MDCLYVTLLPEAIMALSVVFMVFVRIFRQNKTPKTFYSISKYFMFFAAVSAVFLHNESCHNLITNNYYTSLFKAIVYVFIFGWNYLSLKYFQSKNHSSFSFYAMTSLNLLGFSLAISSQNLLFLFVGTSGVFMTNSILLYLNPRNNKNQVLLHYMLSAIFFGILFLLAIFVIYNYANSFVYLDIKNYLLQGSIPWQIYFAFGLIICSFLFMLSVAPFHFCLLDVVEVTNLPVGGYLIIVPIFAYFACLINIIAHVFYPIFAWFEPAMVVFGSMSLFFGAIGANSYNNIRKIFASSSLYYIGVVIICISQLNINSLLSGFTYILTYAFAMMGILVAFLGLRSKGIYLTKLEDINGLSTQRPFVSALMLLFMISLIGMPPFVGFLGKLSIINNLVESGSYISIGIIFASMLILAYAYFRIINAIYFSARVNVFDKVDKAVYMSLSLIMLFIIIAISNPKYVMYDVETMLAVSLHE